MATERIRTASKILSPGPHALVAEKTDIGGFVQRLTNKCPVIDRQLPQGLSTAKISRGIERRLLAGSYPSSASIELRAYF